MFVVITWLQHLEFLPLKKHGVNLCVLERILNFFTVISDMVPPNFSFWFLLLFKVVLECSSIILLGFCWFGWCIWKIDIASTYFVGNKAKGQISKRVFQENKTGQIFRKMKISYPLIRTRTLVCFVFLKHPFSDSPFSLITNDFILNFFGNFFLVLALTISPMKKYFATHQTSKSTHQAEKVG